MKKTIALTKETHKKLMYLKVGLDSVTIDDVINMLIEHEKLGKNGNNAR